jgi:hypothetical protein
VARGTGATAGGGRFTIALSGGSTPRDVYGLLATEEFAGRVEWGLVHVFWSDERCVPPDDARSNYRMAKETLLDRVAGSRELTPRTRDEILARGERLSAAILAAALERAGIPSTVADAQEFLYTDGRAGNAAPDLVRTDVSARAAPEPSHPRRNRGPGQVPTA